MLPELCVPQRLDQLLAGENSQVKFVLYPTSDQSLQHSDTPSSACLLIGPEGGLSQVEIDSALGAGFVSLQLGPRVLRTETAPLAALSLLQYLWGDF